MTASPPKTPEPTPSRSPVDGTKYSGTATVTVKIDKIDLANDVITVGPVLAGKKAFVNSDGNSGILNQGDFANNGMTVMVDGEYLSVDVVNLVAQSVVLADGTTVAPATSYEGNSPAKVSLKVTANQDLASQLRRRVRRDHREHSRGLRLRPGLLL